MKRELSAERIAIVLSEGNSQELYCEIAMSHAKQANLFEIKAINRLAASHAGKPVRTYLSKFAVSQAATNQSKPKAL